MVAFENGAAGMLIAAISNGDLVLALDGRPLPEGALVWTDLQHEHPPVPTCCIDGMDSMRIDFPVLSPRLNPWCGASMAREHPDFSSLTPEEIAILVGPTRGQHPSTEDARRERLRRQIIEAVEQEGLTLEDVFGPAYAGWSTASLPEG